MLKILYFLVLNAMPYIEYIVTGRAAEKPLSNAAIFFEHRMKAILVSTCRADLSLIVHFDSSNVISLTIILLERA